MEQPGSTLPVIYGHACMDAGELSLERGQGSEWVCRHPDNPFAIPDELPGFSPSVIYGQEVLYAARGQDARSRPAKAGIQWFI